MSRIDETKSFIPVRIAVLTVSDTRTLADDRSGDTLVERLTTAGHILADRAIVPDDVSAIQSTVRRWIADETVDVVISTGGTGFTGRDVTPEAVEPLFDKRMDGFSILFHMQSSAKIGTRRSSRARQLVLPARPSYLPFRARRAPAVTPGTAYSQPNSTTVIAPAISSRSCRVSTSTCAVALHLPRAGTGKIAATPLPLSANRGAHLDVEHHAGCPQPVNVASPNPPQ